MKESPRYTRRKILGAALGAPAVAFASACAEQTQPIDNSPLFIETPVATDPMLQVVRKERERIGIMPNPAEQRLWADTHQYPLKPLPINQEAIEYGEQLINETMIRMKNSNNNYFRHAVDVMSSQLDKGFLLKRPTPSTVDNDNLYAFVQPELESNSTIKNIIYFDFGNIVNKSTGMMLALMITHKQHI